jgi:hypothetical protein
VADNLLEPIRHGGDLVGGDPQHGVGAGVARVAESANTANGGSPPTGATSLRGPNRRAWHITAARTLSAGDWEAPLVNGFVNETRCNCLYGVERRVMAWTRD